MEWAIFKTIFNTQALVSLILDKKFCKKQKINEKKVIQKKNRNHLHCFKIQNQFQISFFDQYFYYKLQKLQFLNNKNLFIQFNY